MHRVRTAVGDPAWLVTGYRELQELFLDSRLGRSHPEPGTAARWGDSMLHGGPQGNYATAAKYGSITGGKVWEAAPLFMPALIAALVKER